MLKIVIYLIFLQIPFQGFAFPKVSSVFVKIINSSTDIKMKNIRKDVSRAVKVFRETCDVEFSFTIELDTTYPFSGRYDYLAKEIDFMRNPDEILVVYGGQYDGGILPGISIATAFPNWAPFWSRDRNQEDYISLLNTVWLEFNEVRKYQKKSKYKRSSLAHELGHIFGLKHVNIPQNLMNEGTNPLSGSKLNKGQCETVRLFFNN